MKFKMIQTHFHNTMGDNSAVENCSRNNVGLILLMCCMEEQGKGRLDHSTGC